MDSDGNRYNLVFSNIDITNINTINGSFYFIDNENNIIRYKTDSGSIDFLSTDTIKRDNNNIPNIFDDYSNNFPNNFTSDNHIFPTNISIIDTTTGYDTFINVYNTIYNPNISNTNGLKINVTLKSGSENSYDIYYDNTTRDYFILDNDNRYNLLFSNNYDGSFYILDPDGNSIRNGDNDFNIDVITRDDSNITNIFEDYGNNGVSAKIDTFKKDFPNYIGNNNHGTDTDYDTFMNVYELFNNQSGGNESSDTMRNLKSLPSSSKYKSLLERAMKKRSRKQKGGDTQRSNHTYTPLYTNGEVVDAFNSFEKSSYDPEFSTQQFGNAQIYNTADTSNSIDPSNPGSKDSDSLLSKVHSTLDPTFSGFDPIVSSLPLGNVCTYGTNPTTGRPIRATCPTTHPQSLLTTSDIPAGATYYSGQGGASKSSRSKNKKSSPSRMARKSSRRSTRRASSRKGSRKSRRSTRRANRK